MSQQLKYTLLGLVALVTLYIAMQQGGTIQTIAVSIWGAIVVFVALGVTGVWGSLLAKIRNKDGV